MTRRLTAAMAITVCAWDSPGEPPVQFRFTAEQIEAEMKQAGYVLDSKHDFCRASTT